MNTTYRQSFKQKEPYSPELSIYNCGLQHCEKGHTWGPGIRDHYLIHLVVRGKGRYTMNNKTAPLSTGDIFLVKPNQLISYSADLTEPWEYYWVGFNGAFAGKFVKQMPFTEENPYYHCSALEEAKDFIHRIYESRGPRPEDEARMVGYLYLFISLLMQDNARIDKKHLDSGAQYVVDAIKFIQFNYSHNIGVDDIAEAVGVSRSHLYRVFMSNTGLSPIDYLTNFRIDEACALLEKTSLSVAEVAYSVGFFDQFYFSRVFKKTKGIPPSKYIEQTQAQDSQTTSEAR